MSWDDGPFAGMVVGVETTSMAALLAVEDWERRALAGKPIRGEHIRALATVLVDHVTRWNLRLETGRPVPRTVDAFLRLHRDRVRAILRAWVEHVNQPPPVVEPEQLDEPVVEDIDLNDPALLLEERALQPPGEDEELVASTLDPVLVDA